jgi:carbon starvation protein
MLMEGTLATLVIIAVSAGIGMGYVTKAGETLTGIPAWTTHYASWAAANGLGSKVSAFVDGSANMIASIGLSKSIAVVIMGVFVASFAGTTLDTATRIQRYVLSELFGDLKLDFLTGKYTATFIAVITALILAFATGASGNGAMKLWPLFGATNQTLAALALLVISLYLKNQGGLGWLYSAVPMVFMAIMTIWALVLNQGSFGTANNLLLQVINVIILLITLWIVVEGVIKIIVPGGTPTPSKEAA